MKTFNANFKINTMTSEQEKIYLERYKIQTTKSRFILCNIKVVNPVLK